MKKSISLALAAALALSMSTTALAHGYGHHNTYTPGQFSDVPAGYWCENHVRTAYECGIMDGTGQGTFNVENSLTVAQAVVMACRLHSNYVGDNATFAASDPWYQSYVDYAEKNGILCDFSDYTAAVTRGTFAEILASALPQSALPAISSIQDGAVPDVPVGSRCHGAVYCLYRAGVLTGSDAQGTFYPDSTITRGAAAAIVGRMADPALRQSITLRCAPAYSGGHHSEPGHHGYAWS